MFKANQTLAKPQALQKILIWAVIIHIKQQLLFNIVSFANHTVELECAIVVPKCPGSCVGQRMFQLHGRMSRPAGWSEGIPRKASKVRENQSQHSGNIVVGLQNSW